MNIIVSGGGTGGHIYPAITIIRTIQQKVPDAKFLYVGTKRGLEADIMTGGLGAGSSVLVTDPNSNLSFYRRLESSVDYSWDGFASLRGRVGYAFGRSLVYATGVAMIHAKEGWFVVGAGRNGMEYSLLLIGSLALVALRIRESLWQALSRH